MTDFLKANYHTHTFRCQHAIGTEREYVEAAIEMGIQTLGFSDHIACPYTDGYISGIRMRWEEVGDYVSVLRALAKEYEDQIKILVGFEAEYIPEFYEKQKQMIDAYGIDYLIMGQHFWTSENKGPYSGSPTKEEERIRLYVDSVIRGMKTGSFAYLAHPDLINYQGLDSVYEFEMERLCRAMKDMNIPLEINLLGYAENRHYPNRKFWKIAAETGNQVILGLDAHDVSQIKNKEAYEAGMDIVKAFDLNLIEELQLTI